MNTPLIYVKVVYFKLYYPSIYYFTVDEIRFRLFFALKMDNELKLISE